MKKYLLFLIILLTVLFISCNNQMSTNSADYNAELNEGPFLYTDPVKGVVFVDESGAEVVVKTDEESGEVVCREVIDYAIIDEGESSVSKAAFKTYGRKKAVVLGYRHDGYPGLWIIYTGGKVRPVVHSEDIETSELFELAEARQPFYKHLGWSYKALDLVVNGNEIIIIGYAEHKDGLKWYKYEIDKGTTVGLYWYVRENDNGYYRISRAKVIGYKDYSWWKNYLKKYDKSSYRHWRWYRHRWLRSLRLFFYGWYDRYLTMPETVVAGDNDGEYIITGEDDEGDAAVALVTGRKVLSIEKAPDDPGPGPGPVSKKIVFSSDRGEDLEIFSLDLDTMTPLQLTSNDFDDKHPSLSQDGSKIVFVSNMSGKWAIYTMDSDGNNLSGALVTLTNSSDGHPSWNSDGNMIAYDNNFDIWTMNSSGASQTNLTNTLFDNETSPLWSPDSTKIAYSSDIDGDYDIYSMNSDGSSASNLTNASSGDELSPSWSADGNFITFSTNQDSNYEIYTVSLSGLIQTNLTNTAGDDEFTPSWSSDNSSIAYMKNGDIYKINSDGSGSEIKLTDDAFPDQDPSW